jgi:hypothetical protein
VEDFMAMNLISEDMATFTLQSLKPAVSLDQSAKGTPSTIDPISNQSIIPSVINANTNNTVSPDRSHMPEAGTESNNNSVRMMSHVVVVYNLEGKVRVKFMDSNSNVVYQIPCEMVAKIEDQMMKLESFSATNG